MSASPAIDLGNASSPPPLPPAFSAVEGSRRWHLDPEKLELRPGEPMVRALKLLLAFVDDGAIVTGVAG